MVEPYLLQIRQDTRQTWLNFPSGPEDIGNKCLLILNSLVPFLHLAQEWSDACLIERLSNWESLAFFAN